MRERERDLWGSFKRFVALSEAVDNVRGSGMDCKHGGHHVPSASNSLSSSKSCSN